MADNESASPEDAGIARRPTTPALFGGGEPFYLFQEVFEIAQTLGRVIERLDLQGRKIDGIEESIRAQNEKIDRLSREFGYIKKGWWLVLIVLGMALKAGYDEFIRPMLG